MEKEIHKPSELDDHYDGAIQQITPGPVGSHFMPRGTIDIDREADVVIKRKPQRSQKLALFLYSLIQLIIIGGIWANYSLLDSFADLILWLLTILTFITYSRV